MYKPYRLDPICLGKRGLEESKDGAQEGDLGTPRLRCDRL